MGRDGFISLFPVHSVEFMKFELPRCWEHHEVKMLGIHGSIWNIYSAYQKILFFDLCFGEQ